MAYFYDPAEPPARPQAERIWAAIAHLSVAAPVLGPLVVYWKTRKDQPWAGRNALQALAYSLAIVVLGAGLFLLTLLAGVILTIAANQTSGLPPNALCALPVLLALGALGYAGYAAVSCYRGQSFRYSIVGDLIDGL